MHRTINDLAIDQKYKRQLLNAVARKDNRFCNKTVVPVLYLPDADLHVPFFDRKKGTFSQYPLEQLILNTTTNDIEEVLANAQLFTNPLRFAKKTASNQWTPPSERVTNGGFQVLTFEHDGKGSQSLELQLDWFAGKPGNCPFNKVHKALSVFEDYRGYCVVFSGHKSLHIHIIFDTRHLSKRLAKGCRGALRLWSADVPETALASLHRLAWLKVAGIIKRELNIQIDFDANLSAYYAKRRCPWGVRVIDKQNNIHGFNVDDTVGQIVVQELLLSRSSRKADKVLFSAENISNAVAQSINSKSSSSENPVMATEEADLLLELTDYLNENNWPSYPKPVILKNYAELNKLYFKNHGNDQHPNTFVQGNYRNILPAGVGAPSQPIPLPHHLSLDETIDVCRQRLAVKKNKPAPKSVKRKRIARNWSEKFANEATCVATARELQSAILADVPRFKGATLIQGLPGSGKSHTLMANVRECRWDEDADRHAWGGKLTRGFTAFASPSYKQAAEKKKEYLRLNKGFQSGVTVLSVSKMYAIACDRLEQNPLQRYAIGSAGGKNFLEGVKTLQPDVFAKMVKIRNGMWHRRGKHLCHDNTVLFMTHEMVKHWPKSRLSKAFLHPDFPENYTKQDVDDYCKKMSLYRVIYDEVDTKDLVSIDTVSSVDIAHSVRKHHDTNKSLPWDESSLADQVAAYDYVTGRNQNLDLSFDDCNRIIYEKYCEKTDKYGVDAKTYPFGKGTNKKNMYAKRHGAEYYCKAKNWWQNLGCPVIILTTEDLPTTIFKNIDHGNTLFRSLSLMEAPNLFRELVPVIFDVRARSPRIPKRPNCRHLATDLLTNGTGFVIGNQLNDPLNPILNSTCSHVAAKGRNDLKDKTIGTIISYPSTEQYDEWAIIGLAFGLSNPIQLAYSDMVLQDIGRNLGFRRQSSNLRQPHKIYVKSCLFRDLGYFKGNSKVPFDFYNTAS